MSTVIANPPLQENWSLAELHDHLGGIPLSRIRGNQPFDGDIGQFT